jgi:phage terminase small subunit
MESVMRQRGRKSAEAKAVLSLVDLGQYKPEAPEYLTEEQQMVWSDVVESMKPGSFVPATFPLLSLYCTHVIYSRSIAAELRKTDIKEDLPKFRQLASLQRNESAILCSLATKLRLLPKANTRRDRQETTATSQPWNISRRPRPREDNDDDQPAA